MVSQEMQQLMNRIDALEKLVKQNQITSAIGVNVRFDPGGVSLEVQPNFLIGKVHDATQNSTDYIWKYELLPVQVIGVRNNLEAGNYVYAYNIIELNNPAGGSGVHGNGVDTSADAWLVNYDIIPCPVGTLVMLWRTLLIPDVGYIFSYANGVDGTC